MSSAGLLQRLPGPPRAELAFELDGQPCKGQEGDSVLTAVLTQSMRLRDNDLKGTPRAGFCFMGACQDCWMWLADGRRVRACSEALQPGMQLFTRPPA